MATLGGFSASALLPLSTQRRGSALQGASLRTRPPWSGPRKYCFFHYFGQTTISCQGPRNYCLLALFWTNNHLIFQPLAWPAGRRLVLSQLQRPHLHLDRADQACCVLHWCPPHVLHVWLVWLHASSTTQSSIPFLLQILQYCQLAFLRIHISFGSKMVNAGAFLGALCGHLSWDSLISSQYHILDSMKPLLTTWL